MITPSSETLAIWPTLVTSRSPDGPMMIPAIRYPRMLPNPNRRDIGTAIAVAPSRAASVSST